MKKYKSLVTAKKYWPINPLKYLDFREQASIQ
ncbi:unknown [Bacteroides sp. CAG:144]|nr:unknown [Bacteroides sp. CAG:144]